MEAPAIPATLYPAKAERLIAMAPGVYCATAASPEKRPCKGVNLKTNEAFEGDYDIGKPKSAYIFKTIVDPFIGKCALIKVNSGGRKTDDLMHNPDKDMRS